MQHLKNYLIFRWKSKLFIFCTLIILLFIAVHKEATGIYSGLLEAEGSFGLSFFYSIMNVGGMIMIYLLFILIVPNLYASECLISRKTGFSSLIKLRLGYKKYFKNNVVLNFSLAFITVLITQCLLLLLIHIAYAPIEFTFTTITDTYTNSQLLNPNELISLILFIIFTSIGYGLFSVFLYSLQAWLRNVHLFRLSGLISGILLYTGIVMIGKSIYFVVESPIVEFLSAGLFIGNLLNPGASSSFGVFPNVNSLLAFGLSCLLYGSVTIVFLRSLYKKEYTNE